MVPAEEMSRIQVDLEILALLKMHIAWPAVKVFTILRVMRLELRPRSEVYEVFIAEPMFPGQSPMLVHLVGRHVLVAALAERHRCSPSKIKSFETS